MPTGSSHLEVVECNLNPWMNILLTYALLFALIRL